MSNVPIKPGGKFFQFRNGLGGFFWKGMSTRTDLGAQPVDRPRLVKNGRYIGGHIISRPPTEEVPVAAVPSRDGIDVSGSWHPAWAKEHHSYAGLRLWWGGKPGTTANGEDFIGGHIGFIDTDWDNQTQYVARFNHSFSFAPVLARFANFIYVGDHEALRRIYRVDLPVGQPGNVAEYTHLSPADEIVAAYPGFTTTALHYHEGKLYFALADFLTAANGFIYSWDGYKAVLEYSLTTPGSSGIAMNSYRNTLVVTVRGLGSILVRSATGTWTTHTVAGFDSSGYMNSIAEVKDKLYIMSGGDKIYTWDGTNLALVRTIVGGTTPTRANCCALFNGRLYYMWTEQVGANDYWPWIGVFDPDTVHASYKWKDDYKSLSYTTGTVALVDGHETAGRHNYMLKAVPTAMAVYRQQLIVAVESTLTSPHVRVDLSTHAIANNPYSSWYIIHINYAAQVGGGSIYLNDTMQTRIHYLKVM